MNNFTCPSCGANVGPNDLECKYCGEKLAGATPAPQQQAPVYNSAPQQAAPQQYYQQQPQSASYVDPSWPVKNKLTAGLLAIFLGGLGVHKFYLGKIGLGILYIVFCWTYIPALVGLIEGIIYLTQSDEKFQMSNHVRLI